jgi:8-oxo-dGTP diphosphatase
MLNREYPERPLIGVGAVIVHDGRVLLVKRGNEPLKGHWSIPGGLLELGESLRQGAAREALEETGLVVEVGEVLDAFDSIFTDPDGRTRFHYVLLDFRCRVTGGELRAGGDAGDVRWVLPEELDGLQVTGNVARVAAKALERC